MFPLHRCCLNARFGLDQDVEHRLGRSSKEVPSAVPMLGFLDIDKSDIGIVNQGRGLQRLPRLFLGQFGRRSFRSSS
jgi:hypothetical protein